MDKSIALLDRNLWFPDPALASADGLLACGGDLRSERLLLAYRSGIFPWFNEGDPYLWWSPDPRCVLFPDKLKISRSMRRVLRGNQFTFRMDTAFEAVIQACGHTPRSGQAAHGTWITPEMVQAYTRLHQEGYAHCAEAWQDGVLVGGLYGIRIGFVFFGESMFSHVTDASKYCLINYVYIMQKAGVQLIDCQFYTPHLASLGAEEIARKDFLQLLAAATS